MAREFYRYSALVNGVRRAATFHADAEQWGHETITEDDGTVTPARLNLASAQLLVENDGHVYADFYRFAKDADYEADHTAARLEVLIPARWQIEEEAA